MDRTKLLEWCKLYCNDSTLVDDGAFSIVLDNLIDLFQHAGVTNESLGGMSQSFGADTAFTVRSMLSPFKRLKSL